MVSRIVARIEGRAHVQRMIALQPILRWRRARASGSLAQPASQKVNTRVCCRRLGRSLQHGALMSYQDEACTLRIHPRAMALAFCACRTNSR